MSRLFWFVGGLVRWVFGGFPFLSTRLDGFEFGLVLEFVGLVTLGLSHDCFEKSWICFDFLWDGRFFCQVTRCMTLYFPPENDKSEFFGLKKSE